MGVLMRHAENMKELRRQTDPKAGGNSAKAPPPSPTENVRQGAAYEYLIQSGMTPEQAERVIRSG